jgi:CubicO group peptidase (beta-lactamase class C family)
LTIVRTPAVVIPAALLATLLAGSAQAGPAEQAGALVEQAGRAHAAPGLSAAVALDGKIVYSGATGFADLENEVPATAASVYNIGSISKVNTAVAVMQLVEQGAVGLDDPIRKYVPSLPEANGAITLRQIMTHTSGMRHYGPHDFPDGWGDENMKPVASMEEAVRTIAAFTDPLLFTPGTRYRYSSYAVDLLQGVVECASGRPFEDYMRKYVWSPAGMASTAFDVPERLVPHRARSYGMHDGRPVNARYEDLSYKFAGGGMISTAEDLVRLGIALNHGVLLKPTTVATMYERTAPVPLFGKDGKAGRLVRDQGLMWEVDATGDGLKVFHEGSVKGFEGCLADYPERDLVVAVIGNSENARSCAQTDALAKIFLERPKAQITTR